jgi:hypothetical protein
MACYRTTVAMATLREVDHVRRGAGEPARRWFSSEDLDLIVWRDPAGRPIGFQLCHDEPRHEHALGRVRRELDAAGTQLPADIMAFVADTLARHPDAPSASGAA